MTFEEWYIENEIRTWPKTEYDCMKMAWEAAYEQGYKQGKWDAFDEVDGSHA